MKKYISIICIFILLFSGCTQSEEAQSQNNGFITDDNVHIVNFYKRYSVSERPRITPPPEELPEGIVEYNDEDTFSLRNDKTLHFIKYFPMEYEYNDISIIYKGDIPESVYDAAYEWISVLYEAEKLKDNKKMITNITHRFDLLNKNCVEYVEDKFLEKHVQSMYHYDDIKHCALGTLGDYKIRFQGYKTHYIDFLNRNYYGITAEVRFESGLYAKTRQVPNYIVEKDMGFSVYIEILFDSENKIAGWIEEFYKHSESETNYIKYIVSPERIGYMEEKTYFGKVFHESFGEEETVNYTKHQKDMFQIEKELMYILKDNVEYAEENFLPLKEKCSEFLLNSGEAENFFNEFISDIKEYNVNFQFDPFTIAELDEKEKTQIYINRETKYGDVYSYSSGGLKKTGSNEFNEKYALNPEGYRFEIKYYFVIEENVPKLLGLMLTKSKTEYSETLPERLQSLWNGMKPPIIEEEQG